jgi:WD40 repeat protein
MRSSTPISLSRSCYAPACLEPSSSAAQHNQVQPPSCTQCLSVTVAVACHRWVTCACSLPGGRVLSGGMDGRLWLWPSAGAAGTEIKAAHHGPVSKVAVLQQSKQSSSCASIQAALQTAASAGLRHAGPARISSGSSRVRAGAHSGPVLAGSCSYDKTVKVWDVSGRAGKLVSVMSGHTASVLELAVAPGADALVTGEALSGGHTSKHVCQRVTLLLANRMCTDDKA